MYLYIDTAEQDLFTVALLSDERIIKKRTVKSHRKHSEKLIKSIVGILQQCEKSLKDIEGIVVVKGPGSFTSLRIGIATANALAFGLGVGVFGVGEFENWGDVKNVIKKIKKKSKLPVVVPEYGRAPDIVMPGRCSGVNN